MEVGALLPVQRLQFGAACHLPATVLGPPPRLPRGTTAPTPFGRRLTSAIPLSPFQRFITCCTAEPTWGPYLERHRGERYSHMTDPSKEKDLEIPTVDGHIRSLD